VGAPDQFSHDVPGLAWRAARWRILPILGALLVLVVQSLGTARSELLCACGVDEVFLIRTPTNQSSPGKRLWSWRARGHEELPAALRGSFGTTDDCKPVEGGAKVLIWIGTPPNPRSPCRTAIACHRATATICSRCHTLRTSSCPPGREWSYLIGTPDNFARVPNWVTCPMSNP
jgi:hypothetical protein